MNKILQKKLDAIDLKLLMQHDSLQKILDSLDEKYSAMIIDQRESEAGQQMRNEVEYIERAMQSIEEARESFENMKIES